MIEVFNAAQQPNTEAFYGAFALLPLGWCFWRLRSGRPAPIWIPILAVLFAALTSGVSIWDHWRVNRIIASGEGLRTTKGAITQSWVIESRERDWSKKSLSYRTTISEGFDIGNERFSWKRHDALSGATFSNGGDPPIRFEEGENVEVTWFADPASDNQRRIIRLAIAPVKQSAEIAETRKLNTKEFAVFWRDFSSAIANGDEEGIRALTEVPFTFDGVTVEEKRFAQIFSRAFIGFIRDCLAKAEPREAADKSRSASRGSTTFVFRQNKAGFWRFAALQ